MVENKQESLPRTIHYMGLPFDSWASVREFIIYNRNIQPDQKFEAWEGASAEDIERFGFNSEDPLDSPSRGQSIVGNTGRSKLLRAAGALGLVLLGGAAIIENTHSSEAAAIIPFPNGDLGIDNFPDPAQLIQDVSTTLQNSEVVTGDFEVVSKNGVTLTRIFGEKDPDNRLTFAIIPQGFSSYAEAKERARNIVNYFFLVNPLDRYQDKFTFWVSDPATTTNLGCRNVSETSWVCDDQAKNNEVDRINSTGIIIQEAIVLQNIVDNSREGEHAALDGDRPPSPHTSVVIAMPPNPDADWKKLVVTHGVFHSAFNMAEEYLAGDGNGRVGNTYFNCREDVNLWRGLPGDPGTRYEGCAGQAKGAYRSSEENIMRGYVPDSGPLISWWIDQIMQDPVYRYRLPEPAITIKLSGLNVSADLVAPLGTIQKRRLITPYNSDGPGITLIRNQEASFNIPAPQIGVGNYILLPDMTYTWEERDTNAKVSIPWESQEWNQYNPWPLQVKDKAPAMGVFRTPKRFSDGISAVSPSMGEVVGTSNPILVWGNRDPDVFYYEVQVSKDCSFNTDRQTAIAAVQWNLIHGGETTPLNSYRAAPLEPGIKYCWRVRPRIQGNGTPVAWSPNFEFQTPATLKSAGG